MDAEVKKMWIEALRSGEYKQTRGRLKKGDRYCCLGVLRELAPPEMRNKRAPTFGTLNTDIQKWAGLNTYDPYVWDGRSLVELNDQGLSFGEIAEFIEDDL